MTSGPDVAILLPDLRGGGVERMRLHLAESFLERGLRVELVLLEQTGDLLSHVPTDLTVVSLAAPRLRLAPAPLVRYLRQRRPRSLLAALWPLTAIAIAAARLVPGTRVVVSDHNTLSLTPEGRTRRGQLALRTSLRLFYPFADGIITPSSGVRSDLEQLGGWSRSPIRVVPNPVFRPNAAPFSPLPDSEVWSSTKGRKIIAIGSLKEQKDYPTLLEAFARVRTQEPACLLILGQGSLREVLEARARALGIAEHVIFRGFVPDPRPYLVASDLFVLSSAWEGFGNVIVEALAQGVPVVSTNCPSGPAEILDGGRFGRLAPVRDPEALAQQILAELRDPHDRAALVERAKTYSVEAAATQYLELLLSNAPRGHFESSSR